MNNTQTKSEAKRSCDIENQIPEELEPINNQQIKMNEVKFESREIGRVMMNNQKNLSQELSKLEPKQPQAGEAKSESPNLKVFSSKDKFNESQLLSFPKSPPINPPNGDLLTSDFNLQKDSLSNSRKRNQSFMKPNRDQKLKNIKGSFKSCKFK